MSLTPATKTGRYIGIKADGLFHEKVSEDTEGAVRREYEIKDKKTGAVTKGVKWELLYKDMKDVHLVNVEFEDGEYGENILLTFRFADESEITLAESTAGNFGTDIMKKLPNLSFAEKMTIKPYAFTAENGKEKRGVNFYQGSDKVMGYFWDDETKKPLHGFPEIDAEKTYDSDDWKMHFIGVKKFLVAYTKENIAPKFAKDGVEPARVEYPEDEINPEDIPF